MTETVTITYFNHRLRTEDHVRREVPNLERPAIEAVVDLIDDQLGTVLSVSHQGRTLHRSLVQASDLAR